MFHLAPVRQVISNTSKEESFDIVEDAVGATEVKAAEVDDCTTEVISAVVTEALVVNECVTAVKSADDSDCATEVKSANVTDFTTDVVTPEAVEVNPEVEIKPISDESVKIAE